LNMEDITNKFLNAINQNILWRIDLFYNFLEWIQNRQVEVSFWDDEENWATLAFNSNQIGFLWSRYPLIIIVAFDNVVLDEIKKEYPFISIIETEDLNKVFFKLNYNKLSDYLEKGILDYSHFSAIDLWFNTNSR
jgi:hypothetical protein